MTDLQVTAYAMLVFLVCGYAVLDGFDLGVGLWMVFAGDDRRRQALLRAISPFWDGNEVWLLAVGGAALATFPPVYAAVFSGLYPVIMLLLLALVFRAVALEYGAHEPLRLARGLWHFVVSGASAVALLGLGMVIGNLLHGLPLDARSDYVGGFGGLLNPLSIIVGGLNMALMATHGALYLVLRLEGDLREWARRRAATAWGACLALALATLGAALATRTDLTANFAARPALWALPAATLAAILSVGFLNHLKLARGAFAASVASIIGLLASAAAAMFPRLVPAVDPALSLTIANASSSETSLQAMLVIAGLGMPVVLAYTAWVYWMFRGRVKPEEGH